ncbi:GTP pyrophosphokinase [Rhodoblastus acidophilus]|uniref:GTP pyrophosphokinase rsh n=1 Tax=Rhodoblastus acidophilus TaxID=1074 RepID=A0A212RGS0_RHOAC|nr:bifunctional (p)ppGpp synthetase/guanosine-3',5'-bis(diphosphate) 3'-pyrophosphohydrolase [Rhodoblastus acidophilus]PPQ39599.1 bifunctional (p)ppGpp synthetase/guanosine-3',5'-bis(diphosphate) 3'-pyrophosphohydrolase [Rhodoblastus acidophilus]RAI24382.1 bifunctional (p)ppGpp synthetase/guanosine-3',5'-bis(diphosphate) 3'-pyrophosphohydrolase [Rhodoblastus acidophilus]SNB71498.1 GTP pyrophosphokinase [Rhodoblastus acidophilus]
MMRQYELVDRVRKYNPNANEDLLNRAYVYAMRAHGAQTRASGDPYFTHPLEVAAILTELKLDDATIVAAVLHDTIEDTAATRDEIDSLFGPEIGALVDGLTKLKKLDLVSKKAEQAENFRKLLLAISEDVRVLLVKLADRLHNMRTLHFVKPEKRARIAQETLDIYAPLAGRMGMQLMRDELENLSFKHLNPEAFALVSTRLADLRNENSELIGAIEVELTEELRKRGINAVVRGRQKQPYSVWAKMERKSVAFEQLSDIFGFRVVVDSVEDCYRVIGVVHTKWPAVPGRFKDYISTPKQNDYRSVHTTVVGPGRQRVELQVRTEEMHDIARNGIAAHAFYKDRKGSEPVLSHESSAYQWLKRTIDMLAEGDSPEEFLEHTRLELFHDQVFCFTPKGRLIALPRGATPIDFAYAVHTSVGNSAVGVKINGRLAPLLAPLANGDEVEIIRAETQTPPAAWESIAVTGKARAAIRRASREAVRAQYAGLGRQIVLRAFERAGKAFSDDKLKMALPRLARAQVEDVLAAVGRGEMFSGDVVKAVYPDFKEERKATAPLRPDPGWFKMQKAAGMQFKAPGATGHALPIRGLRGDLPVSFAPDGGAVPGDRIVGILTPGEGVTIYPIQSSALAQFDDQPERWLDVRWDLEGAPELFPAKIVVAAINEPGSLGAVASLIGDSGGNIDEVTFNKLSPDFREMIFELEVFDLKHLTDIVSRVRALPMVHRVERVIG